MLTHSCLQVLAASLRSLIALAQPEELRRPLEFCLEIPPPREVRRATPQQQKAPRIKIVASTHKAAMMHSPKFATVAPTFRSRPAKPAGKRRSPTHRSKFGSAPTRIGSGVFLHLNASSCSGKPRLAPTLQRTPSSAGASAFARSPRNVARWRARSSRPSRRSKLWAGG